MNKRYWQAWFITKVRLWLYFARVVNSYMTTIDRVDVETGSTLTRLDMQAILIYTNFNWFAQDACYGLMYDIMEIQYLFQCVYPYRLYSVRKQEKVSV